jgi:hypothetical protein
MVHEANRRDDLDLAASHVLLVHHAAHAAEVVRVGVGIDHRNHRALAELFIDELQSRGRGLLGGQRVEDDPAGLALDEGDVGEVVSAHLVDAGHHLIEAVVHVKDGLALEGRVDAVEILSLKQPLVAPHVPGNMAGLCHDLLVRRRGDEAFLLFLEVPFILEGKAGPQFLLHLHRVLRRHLALGVEVFARIGRYAASAARVTADCGKSQSQCHRQNCLVPFSHVIPPFLETDGHT